jgi:hypothetical protein
MRLVAKADILLEGFRLGVAERLGKLIEQADDPFVKTELRALASVCEEIADNIEDHLTGEEDHSPRGRLS